MCTVQVCTSASGKASIELTVSSFTPRCSDEVYRPIFHHQDEELPVSVLELGYPHAVVSGSLSKAYSLAGLRIGWLASNDEVRSMIS